MTRTIGMIASALKAEAAGDTALPVERVCHLLDVQSGADLVLAMDPKLVDGLAASKTEIAVVPQGVDWAALGLRAAIFVPRSRYAMAKVTEMFATAPYIAPGVDGLAAIHPEATIDEGAAIGPFVSIGPGAQIGPNTRIMPHVSIAEGASIGPDALIHAGARIGSHVHIGARAVIHMNTTIGADGFSFVTPQPGAAESAKTEGVVREEARNQELVRIHSLGSVDIGDDVEIGACTTIDKGTIRHTRIGSGTKIDNQVQIGHNVVVGRNCMLCAHVGIAGSAEIGDGCVLAGKVGVADHVKIGAHVVVGANAGVANNIASGQVVLGSPAIPKDEAIRVMMASRRLPRLIKVVDGLKKRLSSLEGEA